MAEFYNRDKDQKEKKSAKSIGWYLRERLGIQTFRVTSGDNKDCRAIKPNISIIQPLAQKYGVIAEKSEKESESTSEIPF